MESQPYYFLLSPSLLLFNSTSNFNVQNNSVDTVHANVWLLTCIVSCKYASYDVAFPCFCIQINFCDLDQGLNCSDECTWILDSIRTWLMHYCSHECVFTFVTGWESAWVQCVEETWICKLNKYFYLCLHMYIRNSSVQPEIHVEAPILKKSLAARSMTTRGQYGGFFRIPDLCAIHLVNWSARLGCHWHKMHTWAYFFTIKQY